MWRNLRKPLKLAAATAGAGGVTAAAWLALGSGENESTTSAFPSPSFLFRHPLHAEAQGHPITEKDRQPHSLWTPPSRQEMLNALKGLPKDAEAGVKGTGGEFDLLIVGGGATGSGCAVDAATRGLKVALVERDDFASGTEDERLPFFKPIYLIAWAGTSSRSTKLVHGGVRYLEKAFWELDYEQYKLVKEALHERGVFLKIAPFLSYQLPTMIPLYA